MILALFPLFMKGQSTTVDFDNDWRFMLGDDSLAVAADYDDGQWRRLTLPHDWSIELGFDSNAPAGSDGGYVTTGIGWYRKHFTVNEGSDKGIQTLLYFEGVYMNANVYVNGQMAGSHPYGYTSFWVDITNLLCSTGKNVVSVRVDNSGQKNCRWYSGSGIYRHVRLVQRKKDGINDPWKLFIRTESVSGISADGMTAESATIRISYEGQPDELRTLGNVKLWCPEQPALYDVEYGELTVPFGIRKIEFSATEGFRLNGRPYEINGGCTHHDNGILGAAAFDKAEWRKAELLKKAGFNAVRTSHNPPSEEFIRACDNIGLLVLDEIFDIWRTKKRDYDYHLYFDEWWQRDVDAMVLRDRNHPSIIGWSNGNEIEERGKLEVVTTSKHLADRIRQLDPSRPVTQAICAWYENWEMFDVLGETLDIFGYNYQMQRAEEDHQRVPDRIMWQTESYPRDAFRNWRLVTEHPYVIGDFVWTGIDYLGESAIGVWHTDGENREEFYMDPNRFPYHGAYCGDVDLIGWRKPISHYRSMLYNRTDSLYLAVREPDGYNGHITETGWSVWPTWECWNWPGHEGKEIEVEVYSLYPRVRLYLNDKQMGELPTDKNHEYKATFKIAYQPGVLRAVGVKDDGRDIKGSSQTLSTTGKPTRIVLKSSDTNMKADGKDICFVDIEVQDAKGNVVPDADNQLTFKVTGNATLQAAGNGNIKSPESYSDDTHQVWKGRALAVVRSTTHPGKSMLTITAPGLKPAHIVINSKK